MMIEKTNTIFIVENLSVGYLKKKNRIEIANQINFELSQGELIGLVGANGIGKSTLLRTLTRVQPTLAGNIYLNEKAIETITNMEFAKAMSIVLTEGPVSNNLSVSELIALGRQPHTNWIGALHQNDLEIVNQALKATSLTELRNKKCYELSDGQLQRVMIARALAQDTDLILLDEPTTHLDMYHKAYILKLLKDLSRDTNKTILFSTHEIELAIQICDKLIVMTDNKVLFDTSKNLIAQNVFQNLFPKDLITFEEELQRFKIKN